MTLPEPYIREIRGILGEGEYRDYLAALDQPPVRSLHVNPLKLTRSRLLELMPGLSAIDRIPDGAAYPETARPALHPYYSAGLYYIQEASAMMPANLLPVAPGDRVLDLCAAPGGKTTQLAGQMAGKGILYANDISSSRALGLLKNIELAGIRNCFVTAEDHSRLEARFPEYFDRILVDAPCSGEGMFRREPSMIRDWTEKGPSFYALIQRDILDRAWSMLRPGGSLLFSTCTFSTIEDEGNVDDLLAAHSDAELICSEKLWPHRFQGEGQFMALFRKRGRCMPEVSGRTKVLEVEGRSYEIPMEAEVVRGLRYVRTGLLLGEKDPRGEMQPSQAYAMSRCMGGSGPELNLSVEDERVLRYLKGETIETERKFDTRDWILIGVNGYPLGYAKYHNGRLKNKYAKGWRRLI